MSGSKSVSLKFGLISGAVMVLMIILLAPYMSDSTAFEKAGKYGMFGMGIALSMIFFAIRQVRDKLQNGFITFGEAFRSGLIVALIGSLGYVITWVIYFKVIDDSFISVYTEYQTHQIESGSGTPAEKEVQISQLQEMMSNYRNLPFMITYTFMEVFPFGFLITLVCAILMKRKAA